MDALANDPLLPVTELVCDPLKLVPPLPTPPSTLFGAVIPPLLLSFVLDKYTPKTKLCPTKMEYDYIIVGAGSAGSVLASRLSENSSVSVLVLEAGATPHKLTDIPGIARAFLRTYVDWDYQTVAQKYTAKAHVDRKVQFPSGKTLGGGSTVNTMLFVRGHRQIYDEWEREGATGWNYQNLLPYFKKVEHYVEGIDPSYHGYKGYVNAEKPQYFPEQKLAILEAATKLGYRVGDINGPYAKDFDDITSTYRNGTRCSAGKAYLVPAEDRENLDIVANAFVTKLIIGERDKGKRKVQGVEVEILGLIKTTIRAKREVIVSAGSIRSAQLLMLSGIGPKEHLDPHKIAVLEDLPVGRNFHDHPGVFALYTLDTEAYLNKLLDPVNIVKYLTQRTGPYVSNTCVINTAFLSNDQNAPRSSLPDHQLYFMENVPLIVATQINLKPEEYEKAYGSYDLRASILCISEVLNPKSRGNVTLNSADPYDQPNIDPNYFEQEQDIIDTVEGLKNCDRIFEHDALAFLKPERFKTTFSDCEGIDQNDKDKYFRCLVENLAVTIAHPIGTNRMGSACDKRTVVDPELKVLGFDNLRVVDASIMPIIPPANTNVPTMTVAERAADIIKESWGGGIRRKQLDNSCNPQMPRRSYNSRNNRGFSPCNNRGYSSRNNRNNRKRRRFGYRNNQFA